jgi:threonine/homoserine/homoserine lactone efflux protein
MGQVDGKLNPQVVFFFSFLSFFVATNERHAHVLVMAFGARVGGTWEG